MTKNLFALLMLFALFSINLNAQTEEELKAMKAEKEAQIVTLKAEADALAAQIDKLPGWRFGSFGTIGVNFSQFNNWLGRGNAQANTFTGLVGVGLNGFANLNREKYFWRNSANINLGWTKLAQNKEQRDQNDFERTTDALVGSSLFGYKLSDKWAISVLGEYRTTVLSNFNNPGYFDIGAGVTWTPITDLVVVIHPLNYNFIFADDDVAYTSSLGAKIMADYTRKLPIANGVSWRSNLSAFVSYEDPENLSNWTWVNGFGFTAWKGIGVGFEFGIRGNKQEHLGAIRNVIETSMKDDGMGGETLLFDQALLGDATFDGLDALYQNAAYTDQLETLGETVELEQDSPLQTYWLIGLTYTL